MRHKLFNSYKHSFMISNNLTKFILMLLLVLYRL